MKLKHGLICALGLISSSAFAGEIKCTGYLVSGVDRANPKTRSMKIEPVELSDTSMLPYLNQREGKLGSWKFKATYNDQGVVLAVLNEDDHSKGGFSGTVEPREGLPFILSVNTQDGAAKIECVLK